MEYFTTTSKPSRRAVDCVIVGIYDRGKLGVAASDIDSASKGEIRRLIKSDDISSELGHSAVLTRLAGVKAARVVVVGLGKSSAFGAKQFRKAVAAAATAISKTKAKQALNGLTLETVAKTSRYYLARHSAEAFGEILYRFNKMKSGRQPAASSLKKIGFAIAKPTDAALTMRGAEHGDAIATGVSLAKILATCRPTCVRRATWRAQPRNWRPAMAG